MSHWLYTNSNDTTNFGSAASLDNQEPFTWAAWIFALSQGLNSVAGRVFSKNSGAGFVELFCANNSGLSFQKDYATTDLVRNSADNVLKYKVRWHHVALTWDGGTAASNVHIYLDGVETAYQATTNGAGTKNSDAAANFFIGNRGALARGFDGIIAYPSFHSRVLDVNEITQLMAVPGSKETQKTKLFAPMWVGTKEPDYTSNNNFGTVSGIGVLQAGTYPPISGVGVVSTPCPMSY